MCARELLARRAAGSATLLVSEDLDELLALSDRLIVLYEGRIVGEMRAADADPERLGMLMAGRRGARRRASRMTGPARRSREPEPGHLAVVDPGARRPRHPHHVRVTAGPIALAGANPIEAYAEFLVVPLTSRFSVLEVLVAATPIMLTGAAVALAFRGGYWNIGAEGQLLVGAIAAAAIGQVAGLPQVVSVPLMIAGGAVGGALWALGPAVLRVRFGIDEVVTTLLLNPVALLLVNALLHGPWRDPVSGFPESPRIVETAEFPQLLDRSRLHLGFLVAIVVVVASATSSRGRRPDCASARSG